MKRIHFLTGTIVVLVTMLLIGGAHAQTVNYWFSLQGSGSAVTSYDLPQGQTVNLSVWYQTTGIDAHNAVELLVGYDRTDGKGIDATALDGQLAMTIPPNNINAVFDQTFANDVGGGYSAAVGDRPYGAHLVVSKAPGSIDAGSPVRIADFSIRNESIPSGGHYDMTVYDAGAGDNWTSAIAQLASIWRGSAALRINSSSSSPQPVAIADAKKLADGVSVSCDGRTVTAVFGDYFYIEESDRSSGICVKKAGHGLQPGNTATVVTGVTATLPTGERYIDATNGTVSGSAGTALKPVGMTNKTLGSGDFGTPPDGQRGVEGGAGLNNIGLLVRSTGKATAADPNGFTLDDGSGVTVKVTVPGGGTAYQNEYVAVTGISSLDSTGARVIKARTTGDVQIM